MTAFWNRAVLASAMALLLGVARSPAQPPKSEEPKKDEPPTKEELELRRGSRNLVYKFVVGEEFQTEAQLKRVETRTIQSQTKPDTQDLHLKMVLKVDALLPKGGADMSAHVTHVKFTRVGREMRKYDSNSSRNADDSSEGWELYTDARFKFKVDSRGKVTEIRPDAATADFWKQQPRELRALVAEEVIKTFLPFFALPSDLVRRGTDWKETRVVLEEPFGKREVAIDFSYHGSQTISGRPYEEIRLRGKAKQVDPKLKYDIDEQHAHGKFSFDMQNGNLRDFHFEQFYVFAPAAGEADTKADAKKKEDDKKKEKDRQKAAMKGRMGVGAGSSAGYSGSGMNDPRGGGGGNKGKKKKKDEKEAEDALPEKVVKIEIENNVNVIYRGKPVSGE